MPIYALDGVAPELPANGDYFVAETAVLIGRVRLLPGASVWFGAVLRGDNEWIEVGEGSNVQDGSVLHTDMGAPLTIGPNATIGHAAIVHGCSIAEGALIGMGATVLNHARIGRRCLVGANALVPEGRVFEDGQLVLGAPAKAVKALDEEALKRLELIAAGYRANAARFRAGLVRIG
jgi:carbonic anhydrase/acetyltransferase-like protein (isoleucine patch superfamily)